MDFFGYPIWTVALICVGVFCASFMDAIGGGGGIISLPSYLLAGVPMHFALGTNKLGPHQPHILEQSRANVYLYPQSTTECPQEPCIVYTASGARSSDGSRNSPDTPY